MKRIVRIKKNPPPPLKYGITSPMCNLLGKVVIAVDAGEVEPFTGHVVVCDKRSASGGWVWERSTFESAEDATIEELFEAMDNHVDE